MNHPQLSMLNYHKCIVVILLLLISVVAQAKIVFTSSRDGTREIYVMDDGGSDIQRLTDNQLFEKSPVWSPDGKQIAFTRDVDADIREKQFDIILMDADGDNPRNLTDHPAQDGSPAWSPDGEHIAFTSDRSGRNEIHILDIFSGKVRQLTDNRPLDGTANDPSWSPDGRYIAYKQSTPRKGQTIYIMDVKREVTDPLTPPELSIIKNRPRWSPNGKYILYHEISFADVIANANQNPNVIPFIINLILGAKDRLVITSVDGLDIPKLTIPEDWSFAFGTGWSPNSKEIIFAASPERWGGNSDIYRYHLNIHKIVNITNNPSYDGEPNWLNRTLAVNPAGKMSTQWGQIKK